MLAWLLRLFSMCSLNAAPIPVPLAGSLIQLEASACHAFPGKSIWTLPWADLACPRKQHHGEHLVRWTSPMFHEVGWAWWRWHIGVGHVVVRCENMTSLTVVKAIPRSDVSWWWWWAQTNGVRSQSFTLSLRPRAWVMSALRNHACGLKREGFTAPPFSR